MLFPSISIGWIAVGVSWVIGISEGKLLHQITSNAGLKQLKFTTSMSLINRNLFVCNSAGAEHWAWNKIVLRKLAWKWLFWQVYILLEIVRSGKLYYLLRFTNRKYFLYRNMLCDEFNQQIVSFRVLRFVRKSSSKNIIMILISHLDFLDSQNSITLFVKIENSNWNQVKLQFLNLGKYPKPKCKSNQVSNMKNPS